MFKVGDEVKLNPDYLQKILNGKELVTVNYIKIIDNNFVCYVSCVSDTDIQIKCKALPEFRWWVYNKHVVLSKKRTLIQKVV